MASAPYVDVPGGTTQQIQTAESPVKTKAELIDDSNGVQKTPTSPWGSAPSTTSPWGSPTAGNAGPSSFWGPKPAAASAASQRTPNSFADIMSEELAVKLAADEEEHLKKAAVETENDEDEEDDPDLRLALELSKQDAGEPAKPEDSDLLMAQLLQLEFDKEYDAHLARQEQHVNQNSKVTLSYRKYSHLHPVERDTERELYEDEEVME